MLRRSGIKPQPVSTSLYKYLAQAAAAVGASEVRYQEPWSDAPLCYPTAFLAAFPTRAPNFIQVSALRVPLLHVRSN